MDVEIVLDQDDCPCVGEMDIGQVFQDMRIVHGGVAIGDFDMAPAFERKRQAEAVQPIVLKFQGISASMSLFGQRLAMRSRVSIAQA